MGIATAQLLTVAKAAEIAGVHRDTIRRWVREEGLGVSQPAGPYGAVRIDSDELHRFLNRDSRERLADRVHVALPRARQRRGAPGAV